MTSVEARPMKGWESLMDLWKRDCWGFGEVLAFAIVDPLPPDSSLRTDDAYIEDAMRAVIGHLTRRGANFGSGVDVMILSDGARRATGELPRKYTAPGPSVPDA